MNPIVNIASCVRPAARGMFLLGVPLGLAAPTRGQPASPPGADKSVKTRTLEVGAKALQRTSPLGPMEIHLVGFHPMKDHPERQVVAHHFCHQVNEDFAQCVLFDGSSRKANLNGIEYIISERLFETLPVAERSFWHPHNGEILSGQQVASGTPARLAKAATSFRSARRCLPGRSTAMARRSPN